MNTPGKRFRLLPRWLAGVYFTWSLFVYIFADHGWWPMFLYPLIWPVSSIWEHNIDSAVFAWLAPQPGTASEETYALFDRISGGFYLVVGSFWLWLIGTFVSWVATVLFPLHPNPIANDRNA